MNWRWKARVQRIVATLPRADSVYHALQRTVGSLRGGGRSPLEWFSFAAGMIEWFAAAGRELAGKRVFELGTGRNLNIPIALWLAGAGRIVTADLNRYLSESLVFDSIHRLRRHQDEVGSVLGPALDRHGFGERWKRLMEFTGGLQGLLRLINTTYLAPSDATSLPCPAHSIDLYISQSVLEHVRLESIAALLVEARRIVTPDGVLIHFIDPSDHFSHSDASITAINFLQFSESEWNKWAGNKFAYHNRLRGCQYPGLFEQAGFTPVRTQRAVDQRSLALLRTGFPVDRRFQDMSAEDLAVSGFMIMATAAQVQTDASPGDRSSRTRASHRA